MLPDAPQVSGFSPFFLYSSATRHRGSDISLFPAEGDRERRAVRPAHTPSPSARAAQRREQERATRKKRRIRRRERREQRDEEFRLREQQGLSPPTTSEYSSSGEEEEEESDGGQPPLRGGSLRPLTESHGGGRGASAWASAEAPATRRSTEGVARVVEAPARAAEESGSAVAATPVTAIASGEPSRKRKRGFSTLR
jgi:hypothetical protein